MVARTAMKKSLNNVAAKYITKQVTKFIPLGGQIIAASLGYVVMKKVADAHVEESYKLAKAIQMKQGIQQGKAVTPPVTNVPSLEKQQEDAQPKSEKNSESSQ